MRSLLGAEVATPGVRADALSPTPVRGEPTTRTGRFDAARPGLSEPTGDAAAAAGYRAALGRLVETTNSAESWSPCWR